MALKLAVAGCRWSFRSARRRLISVLGVLQRLCRNCLFNFRLFHRRRRLCRFNGGALAIVRFFQYNRRLFDGKFRLGRTRRDDYCDWLS